MIKIVSNLEKAACLSKRDGKREERLHILYFLGFLYYKRKDFLTAKERLKSRDMVRHSAGVHDSFCGHSEQSEHL